MPKQFRSWQRVPPARCWLSPGTVTCHWKPVPSFLQEALSLQVFPCHMAELFTKLYPIQLWVPKMPATRSLPESTPKYQGFKPNGDATHVYPYLETEGHPHQVHGRIVLCHRTRFANEASATLSDSWPRAWRTGQMRLREGTWRLG